MRLGLASSFFLCLFFTHSLFAQVANQVIIYSTSWCPYCQQAKAYFDALGVGYSDNDIEHSPQAREAYKSLNGKGIPLVFIGNSRFDGFDPVGFENALAEQEILKPSQN